MKYKDFIIGEFLQFSIQAGFATRNEDYPIYDIDSTDFSTSIAKNLKNDIREFLISSYKEIQGKKTSEEEHIQRIETLSSKLSKKYKSVLHNGQFRLGVPQKIYNLFLKYLWSINLIDEPIHCPFDNIVKMKLRKFADDDTLIDWTEMESIKDYKKYVSAASKAAKMQKTTVAQWEMINWKRRSS